MSCFICFLSFFKECPHPDDKQRKELSRELGLEPLQVKFWFQNKRTQMKVTLLYGYPHINTIHVKIFNALITFCTSIITLSRKKSFPKRFPCSKTQKHLSIDFQLLIYIMQCFWHIHMWLFHLVIFLLLLLFWSPNTGSTWAPRESNIEGWESKTSSRE